MPANDDDDDRPRKRPWDSKGRGDDDRPRKRPRDEEEEDDDRPRKRRRDEDDDDYEHDNPRRAAKQGSNGLATAGLILGLLSFCTAGIAGIPGVICSALALGKPAGRGMAIGGLIASLLGILAWIGLGAGFYFGVKPAGERMKDANNMKQIGLGFHNQEGRNMGMTGPFATDERGIVNTGLSFRVGLLPYVEQDSLHRQFDMTQAWNSPKNKPAANTKVAVFTAPYSDEPASTNTPYRVFYGGGALFNENGKPVNLMSITDGTSNTIMLVHASDQVPWAEPREFKYSDTTPLPKLGQPGGKGANVLMADGSVRFITSTVPERTLRLLITKADGNPVPGDW